MSALGRGRGLVDEGCSGATVTRRRCDLPTHAQLLLDRSRDVLDRAQHSIDRSRVDVERKQARDVREQEDVDCQGDGGGDDCGPP